MTNNRLFICIKDIVSVTGKSYETCRKEYENLKFILGKKENQEVTFQEYADYTGVSVDEIKAFIK